VPVFLNAIATPDQWMNLSAVGALITCMIWGITKGLPALVERFTDAMVQQRADFREELKEQRLQSRSLAQSGHVAVNRLSDAFNELRVDLTNGKSGILKHDSIHKED
jgi:cytochrome b